MTRHFFPAARQAAQIFRARLLNEDIRSDGRKLVKRDRVLHRTDTNTAMASRMTGIVGIVNSEGRVNTQAHEVRQLHMVMGIRHVERFQIDQKMSDRGCHIPSSAGDFCAEENIPALVKKQPLLS